MNVLMTILNHYPEEVNLVFKQGKRKVKRGETRLMKLPDSSFCFSIRGLQEIKFMDLGDESVGEYYSQGAMLIQYGAQVYQLNFPFSSENALKVIIDNFGRVTIETIQPDFPLEIVKLPEILIKRS